VGSFNLFPRKSSSALARITVNQSSCIYFWLCVRVNKKMKYFSRWRRVVFFGKLLVAPQTAGWLQRQRMLELFPFAFTRARSRSVPFINGFVDDSLWNAGPRLNEALLSQLSQTRFCVLAQVASHLPPPNYSSWPVQVRAVWQLQVGCDERGCPLLQ